MNDFSFGSEHRRQCAFEAQDFQQQRVSKTRSWDRPRSKRNPDVVGILASGGLDSSILLKHMLDAGRRVKPLYVQSGLCWQADEKMTLEHYLAAVSVARLEPLTVLDLPLADLYGDHWSITGRNTPDANTPDEAVFLPGRNALLTIKAALWCQLHGIDKLAIATLVSNPFEDASDAFFDQLEQVFNTMRPSIHFLRPFAGLNKQQVMELGQAFPLDWTFSCIAPREGAHCGKCNKCAERQAAFRLICSKDPTQYARPAVAGRTTE